MIRKMTLLSVVVFTVAACGEVKPPVEPAPSSAPPTIQASSLEWAETFDVADTELTASGNNPYFNLEPGHRIVMEGKEGDETTRVEITVLKETELVDGVVTRVVEERESKNGRLVEISRNFFAISSRTNDVFYFGEDVDIYRDGKIVDHHGAWRAGDSGARFGLVMPGSPAVGQKYYQEIAPGIAMDRAEHISITEIVETPAGKFETCLKVHETTPLEPNDLSVKLYAPGIGMIGDGSLRLLEHGMK